MRRIGEAEEMLILLELVTILVAARCKWTVFRLTSVPYNFDIGHVYLSMYALTNKYMNLFDSHIDQKNTKICLIMYNK